LGIRQRQAIAGETRRWSSCQCSHYATFVTDLTHLQSNLSRDRPCISSATDSQSFVHAVLCSRPGITAHPPRTGTPASRNDPCPGTSSGICHARLVCGPRENTRSRPAADSSCRSAECRPACARQDPNKPEAQKLGMFNPNTWGAYVLNGEAFIKRAEANPAENLSRFRVLLRDLLQQRIPRDGNPQPINQTAARKDRRAKSSIGACTETLNSPILPTMRSMRSSSPCCMQAQAQSNAIVLRHTAYAHSLTTRDLTTRDAADQRQLADRPCATGRKVQAAQILRL